MEKKPKIALMTYAIDGRLAKGTAILARKYTEALIKRKEDFDLTFFHFEKVDDPIYSHGVREVIFPTIPVAFLNRRMFRFFYYILTATEEYDLVQWFQPRLYPFFWKFKAKKIFVGVHGTGDLMKGLPFDLMRYVFNWTVKTFKERIDVALVGSHFAARDVVEQYGFAPEKVKVIYYGAEGFSPATKEEIDRVRKKYSLPEDFFLGIGRLNPNKNIPRILRAFHIFASENIPGSDRVHFVNIGDRGSEREIVDEIISESAFGDRIHLVSYVDTGDLSAVYSASRAVIFPLLNEGLGLPVVESLYAEVPVVASNTCYPDITDEHALLVDALSKEEIAQAMRKLFLDPEYGKKLVENSRAHMKMFSWDRAGEELVNLYIQHITAQ